jgi:phosphoglycolate phosphatase
MTRPYDLAVFDFDGTLADSFPFFLGVHNELARKHGFPEVAEHEVPMLRELPTRELAKRARLPAWRLPVVARDFVSRMHQADPVPLFTGVPDALRGLRESGLRLALVTSNSRANALRVLGPELSAGFEHVDCGASMFGKAARLRRVLKALGVEPRRSLYIGDQTADADAARAAGMDFGAVHWGYATPTALAALHPAREFEQPAALMGLAGVLQT